MKVYGLPILLVINPVRNHRHLFCHKATRDSSRAPVAGIRLFPGTRNMMLIMEVPKEGNDTLPLTFRAAPAAACLGELFDYSQFQELLDALSQAS